MMTLLLAGLTMPSSLAFAVPKTPVTEKNATNKIPGSVSDSPGQTDENPAEATAPEKPSEFEQLLDKELGIATDKPEVKKDETSNWFFQIVKTIFGLAVVIGIILLLQKFLRYKSRFVAPKNEIIKTWHEYSIESGKKMRIIEIGNRFLLIGISDAGIQLITEFKEQVHIDQIKLTCESFGATEQPDMWLDLTNLITNKVQDLFSRKQKMTDTDDHSGWANLQSNARQKVDELRQKKKLFEDRDDFHDQ